MSKIEVECPACGATGLYCGFAEPKGTAVVCNQCGGTGKEVITYTPFTHRKQKRGVQWVLADHGLWFSRNGNEKKIPVEEFYKK